MDAAAAAAICATAPSIFLSSSPSQMRCSASIRAGQHAVVQRLEGDAALAQLHLAYSLPLMHSLRCRGSTSRTSGRRAEVLIHAVEVVVVDHRGAVTTHGNVPPVRGQRRRCVRGTRAFSWARPRTAPFLAFEALEVLLRDIVLRWCLLKLTKSTPPSSTKRSTAARTHRSWTPVPRSRQTAGPCALQNHTTRPRAATAARTRSSTSGRCSRSPAMWLCTLLVPDGGRPALGRS